MKTLTFGSVVAAIWALVVTPGVRGVGLVTVSLLVALGGLGSTALYGSYPDKHGNEGVITLGSPIVNGGGGAIDYAVSYNLTDSEGNKSGGYVITSDMLPGRDPGSDDFVLNVFVIDDASQNAAELVFSNNPNTAPLMPILRLLDCSSIPCTEVKRYDDPKWGCWVIQDQSDIADYPIELLDARVILKLLEPAQLSMLPNSTDGTGNWADIMENHRTNFNEAKFRADTETLGALQSDLLTMRMIDELEDKLGIPDPAPGVFVDWLRKHSPGISHGELSFFTGHKDLIEELTTVLFTDYHNDWPLDFTFPFGRMPVFLLDPDDDAGPDSPAAVDPFHQIPTHWERVIANPDDAAGALGQQGCWHNWPLNAYAPILDNDDVVMDPGEGSTNLGQFECATVITANGFADRPCTDPADYTTVVNPLGTERLDGAGNPVAVNPLIGSILTVEEGDWHNPIHGIIAGTFAPIEDTAGTMIFWSFHTYASTVALANWRHAQKRDMGVPNRTPLCDANGPYLAECQGTTTAVQLDGTGSSDPDGDALSFTWTNSFGTASGATPTVEFPGLGDFPVDLEVDDGFETDTCSATVTIEDTTPPVIHCNSPATIAPPDAPISFTATVTDICDPEVIAVITGFDCFAIKRNGRVQDKTESCEVSFADDTITILNSGGVGDHITWNVTATDGSGNQTDAVCEVVIVNPAQ